MPEPDVNDLEDIPGTPDVDAPDPTPGTDSGEPTGEEQAEVNRRDDPPS
jgi:hypothetical protein